VALISLGVYRTRRQEATAADDQHRLQFRWTAGQMGTATLE
jgi:hypothetical protein